MFLLREENEREREKERRGWWGEDHMHQEWINLSKNTRNVNVKEVHLLKNEKKMSFCSLVFLSNVHKFTSS